MHELAVREVLERYAPVLRRLEPLRFSSLDGRAHGDDAVEPPA
ncbi:hypothetical protein [Pseudonocardia oceani]|nr:hypothetical protein [Pseudonocardia oceani]